MGTVGLLISGIDQGSYKSKDIVSIKHPDFDWGSKEVLPNWLRVNISDMTTQAHHDQAVQYIESWRIEYTHQFIGTQPDTRNRYLIRVDPQFVSASGLTKTEIKTEFEAWFLPESAEEGTLWYGSDIVRYDGANYGVELDIPAAADVQELKADFNDKMKSVFDFARYYIGTGAFNAIVAAGGEITETKAVVLSYVKDKLDD